MISYFNNGNGKLTICEDSLTASVFDLLKYLPSNYFWFIIKDALLLDNLPKFAGEIQEIVFWPKWSAEETNNNKYVEPDVFIRFQEFDLIIEAKRYDANQQKEWQLKNEILSYYNEFLEGEKELFLLQVGGLKEDCTDNFIIVKNNKIFQSKTNWTRLLFSINNLYQKIITQQLPDQNSLVLLFSDLINAFAMHGFHQKKWLDNCVKYPINLEAIEQFNLIK